MADNQLLNVADAVFVNDRLVDVIYAGTVRIWPEAPPPLVWQEVGKFGAFDVFHRNPSLVPDLHVPYAAEGKVTCVMDRNENSLTFTCSERFTFQALEPFMPSLGAGWPRGGEYHPDWYENRNGEGLRCVLDAVWTASPTWNWAPWEMAWNLAGAEGTMYQWGEWPPGITYPFIVEGVNAPPPSPGEWSCMYRANGGGELVTIQPGWFKITNPTVTWYELLPQPEEGTP